MSIPVTSDTVGKISRYWKTVVAVLGAVSVVGAEVVQAIANGSSDGTFDTTDGITVALVILTAIGVYAKRNVTPAGEPTDPSVSEAEIDTTDASW